MKIKKFISDNCYVLLLFSLFFSIVYLFFLTNEQRDYMKVKVQTGDSVWTIAERYSKNQSIDEREFVKRVETMNQINADIIKPGQELIIPISKNKNVNL